MYTEVLEVTQYKHPKILPLPLRERVGVRDSLPIRFYIKTKNNTLSLEGRGMG